MTHEQARTMRALLEATRPYLPVDRHPESLASRVTALLADVDAAEAPTPRQEPSTNTTTGRAVTRPNWGEYTEP